MQRDPLMWLVYIASFVYLIKTCSAAISKARAENREMKAYKRRDEYAREKAYGCKAAGGTIEESCTAYTVARKWADANIA
jgi:hypothetical protein